MPTPSGALDAAAIKLHRRGGGAPLVLVHCLGVDRHLWDIATAGLASDFTLVSYDLPGQGGSPVPDNAYREALAEVDLTSLAPKIKAPTLIVIGEQDLPAFHKSAKWLEQNIADSRKVVLAPARHASILERPEEFSEAARAFLRG
jgi:pimeloyl-ACP methyl ester carboxylesterase